MNSSDSFQEEHLASLGWEPSLGWRSLQPQDRWQLLNCLPCGVDLVLNCLPCGGRLREPHAPSHQILRYRRVIHHTPREPGEDQTDLARSFERDWSLD
ncbi:unnamed protein product [Calypogeia fissa]